MLIQENQTSSSLFIGTADPAWVNQVSQEAGKWLKSAVVSVKDFVAHLGELPNILGKAVSKGWNFFTGWFKADPFGATAGAAVVALGIFLVVPAAAGVDTIALVGGSVTGLFTIGTALRTGVIAGINAFLGNPIGKVIRFLVKETQFLYNFNWQITDESLLQQQEGLLTSLYAASGDAAGRGLAGLFCGVIPGLALVKLNFLNAVNFWEVANSTIKSQFLSSLSNLLNISKEIITQKVFAETFKNSRKIIKSLVVPGSPLAKMFPDQAKMIQAWGGKDAKPWSFAISVQEKIKAIPDKNLKAFTGAALSSFMNSCSEDLIAISNAI